MGLDDAARHLADSAESLYRTATEFANTHVTVGVPELDAALSARQTISAQSIEAMGDDMAAGAAEAAAQLFERNQGNQ